MYGVGKASGVGKDEGIEGGGGFLCGGGMGRHSKSGGGVLWPGRSEVVGGIDGGWGWGLGGRTRW